MRDLQAWYVCVCSHAVASSYCSYTSFVLTVLHVLYVLLSELYGEHFIWQKQDLQMIKLVNTSLVNQTLWS